MLEFQENVHAEARKDGWTGGQTLFHKSLLATPGGPKRRPVRPVW